MEMTATLIGSAKLLLVLAACYVAGAGLFARRGEPRSEPDDMGLAVVWFVAGLCLASLFFLLSKVGGSGLIFYAGLPVLVAALHVFRRPALRARLDGDLRMAGWALAFSALASLPVAIMGVRMGVGEYPAEFFSVDSPFFLQQIHALIQTDTYPPPSFEVHGFSFKYHYGLQAFVALASVLTGLKPHFVLFAVIEPLLEVLTGLVIYDICRRLTGSRIAALACLLLMLLGSKQYLVNYFSAAGWDFVLKDENFNYRFPNPPNVAGLLVALCAVRCSLEFGDRRMRVAAWFFTCLLLVFKIPYVIPVSAGLAFVYLYELRKRASAGLLIELACAVLLSGLCYVTFAMDAPTTRATAEFRLLGFMEMALPWHNESLLIFCALAAAVAVATRQALSDDQRRLLIIALSPYLLFSLCDFENGNQYQVFDLAIKLVALFVFTYIVSAWLRRDDGAHRWRRVLAIGIVAGLTGPGAVSLLAHIHVVTMHPERGHEYADNRLLGDALRHVPLDNTLLVTNDLRYPANDYFRDYRQLQLAGLFGHRNLGSNLQYGGLGRDEINMHVGILRLFQQKSWPATQVSYVLEKFPVTHLLIRKHYPHADDIPLALVYENRDYAVYRFRTPPASRP